MSGARFVIKSTDHTPAELITAANSVTRRARIEASGYDVDDRAYVLCIVTGTANGVLTTLGHFVDAGHEVLITEIDS